VSQKQDFKKLAKIIIEIAG